VVIELSLNSTVRRKMRGMLSVHRPIFNAPVVLEVQYQAGILFFVNVQSSVHMFISIPRIPNVDNPTNVSSQRKDLS